MEPHADLALVEDCRANRPGAFEAVYRAHAPRLFGLACRLVGRSEAEDVLQEVFLTAHRKLGLYRGESSLGTWLFRLATNQCLDHLRSKRARFAALTDLPPGCRAVFVLHDVEGCEHKEIGEMLGIADGTSKSQLHKARMRLRAALAGGASRAESAS